MQIIVPWRSLSSSPVEVVIQGVNLIICNLNLLVDDYDIGPKSKEDWELIETFHTNFELREQVIKDFAMQIYNSIIVSLYPHRRNREKPSFLEN